MSLDDILRDYPLCYHRTNIKLSPAKPIQSGTYTHQQFEQMINDGVFDGWYPVQVTFHGLNQSPE
mgnify:CR=1 FL=1